MNFIESIITCYIKTFNYKGRASKSEYWWFQLYFSLFAVLFLTPVFANVSSAALQDFFMLVYFFNNLPLMSAAVRRFHDMNKSGWLVLWSLVPFIGAFIVLIMLAGDGTKGKNKFGPKPKK